MSRRVPVIVLACAVASLVFGVASAPAGVDCPAIKVGLFTAASAKGDRL